VVDAITGNFLDSATYTKPYGWETNMTRQNATIANYVNGSYVAVPYEDAGAPDYGALSHRSVAFIPLVTRWESTQSLKE